MLKTQGSIQLWVNLKLINLYLYKFIFMWSCFRCRLFTKYYVWEYVHAYALFGKAVWVRPKCGAKLHFVLNPLHLLYSTWNFMVSGQLCVQDNLGQRRQVKTKFSGTLHQSIKSDKNTSQDKRSVHRGCNTGDTSS